MCPRAARPHCVPRTPACANETLSAPLEDWLRQARSWLRAEDGESRNVPFPRLPRGETGTEQHAKRQTPRPSMELSQSRRAKHQAIRPTEAMRVDCDSATDILKLSRRSGGIHIATIRSGIDLTRDSKLEHRRRSRYRPRHPTESRSLHRAYSAQAERDAPARPLQESLDGRKPCLLPGSWSSRHHRRRQATRRCDSIELCESRTKECVPVREVCQTYTLRFSSNLHHVFLNACKW
jgi:hypothetical protein